MSDNWVQRERTGAGSLSGAGYGQGGGAPSPDGANPAPGSAGADLTSPSGRGWRAAVLASLLSAGGCAPVLPGLAQPGGDAAFKARIAETYRPGMSGAVLRADFLRDRFVLYDEPVMRRHTALFAPDNLPCYSFVRVDWTEDRGGRIAQIQAQRHPCS